ncbi:NACHT domain-containing protein [Actinoplanes sp. CA-252034]|uniref:NACHT domain-containing protein n=1 Tax=Actinoplanes sp. CA-252034 TaxID=3239906 RepID=UPI003D972711
MRNSIPTTYREALRLLGGYEPALIQRLDSMLGGAILGAGAFSAVTAFGGGTALPIALLIWGWIDQKNEATKLLRQLVTRLSRHINNTSGYSRRQLIVAAHTAIVAEAYFSALSDHLGKTQYKALELTEAEKSRLIKGVDIFHPADYLGVVIYDTAVPTPSAARGYEENVEHVARWLSALSARANEFFTGLENWRSRSQEFSDCVIEESVNGYRERFTDLARDVPEFWIWSTLDEHAATRALIRSSNVELLRIVDRQGAALGQLEHLLAAMQGKELDTGLWRLREIISRANRTVLSESIVPTGIAPGVDGLTFPLTDSIYLDPRFKVCRSGGSSRIADEQWWDTLDSSENLGLFLAGFLSSPEASSKPLVVLGHPGAGKSLLTKLTAARLSSSDYTAVRVPLRSVHSGAPLYEQLQQALDLQTSGRVRWSELAEEARDAIRVVFLDGLDELIQAAPGTQYSFFRSVSEFQRMEESQGLPVIVIVTSRTVVMDQIDVPPDTPIVKLEPFDEAQIVTWLAEWRRANSLAIASGRIGCLEDRVALDNFDLSRQPLLLTMLAIYSADPSAPPLAASLSTATLYRRLLDSFAAREVLKLRPNLGPIELEAAMDDKRWNLTVAAFAMFNRGRQYVADYQLGEDLRALEGSDRTEHRRDADVGRDIAAQFFFVHSAEARIPGQEEAAKCYEFLHATFGEFLVADESVALLRQAADGYFARRRSAGEPDDAMLFALLSWQPLISRSASAGLLEQICRELTEEEQGRILTFLGILISRCRGRKVLDRFSPYRPISVDNIRSVAVYSLNLLTIRIAAGGGKARPKDIWLEGEDCIERWRSLVQLWNAGLDAGSWQTVLKSIEFADGVIRWMHRSRSLPASRFLAVSHARMLGDTLAEKHLRFGVALLDDSYYSLAGDDWESVVMSRLSALMTSPRGVRSAVFEPLPSPPTEVESESRGRVQNALSSVIRLRSMHMARAVVIHLLRYQFDSECFTVDPYALAAALRTHRGLEKEVPEIADPGNYAGGGWGLWFYLDSFSRNRLASELCEALAPGIPGLPSQSSLNRDEVRVIIRQIIRSQQESGLTFGDAFSGWSSVGETDNWYTATYEGDNHSFGFS